MSNIAALLILIFTLCVTFTSAKSARKTAAFVEAPKTLLKALHAFAAFHALLKAPICGKYFFKNKNHMAALF